MTTIGPNDPNAPKNMAVYGIQRPADNKNVPTNVNPNPEAKMVYGIALPEEVKDTVDIGKDIPKNNFSPLSPRKKSPSLAVFSKDGDFTY